MKVEFSRNILMKALNTIDKFALICKDKKEYNNLKIEIYQDKASLEVGSDRGFLHLEVECKTIEEGIACFSISDFINIITKLSGEIVLLESSDGVVIISDQASKIKLHLINNNLFTATIGLTNKLRNKLIVPSKELIEAANLCLPFEDEPQLIPGINIKLMPDNCLQLCCCSNAAMGMYTIASISTELHNDLEFVLPTQSFKSLCDIIKEASIEMEVFGTIIRIALPNGFITLKTLNKTFPKIEKIIPSSFVSTIPLYSSALNNALSLIDIIAFDGSVLLEYIPNKCIISNKAGFCTSIDTKVDITATIKIERRLLKRLLRLFPSQSTIELLYNDYLKPIAIKNKNKFIMLSVLEQK